MRTWSNPAKRDIGSEYRAGSNNLQPSLWPNVTTSDVELLADNVQRVINNDAHGVTNDHEKKCLLTETKGHKKFLRAGL